MRLREFVYAVLEKSQEYFLCGFIFHSIAFIWNRPCGIVFSAEVITPRSFMTAATEIVSKLSVLTNDMEEHSKYPGWTMCKLD